MPHPSSTANEEDATAIARWRQDATIVGVLPDKILIGRGRCLREFLA